jgi:type IV/VI secretion system ImpK/VasF family protein
MTPARPASSVGPTNLAWLHQETLTSIVRLRSGRQQVSDARYFRGQIKEALRGARDQALNLGYSDQALKDTQLALAALLDATILELGSPVFEGWSRDPLQEEMLETRTAGEGFFHSLERLMAQPDTTQLADTLEVYLLCLLLGHGGWNNAQETAAMRTSVMERLFRMRGYTGDLSPAWRPPVDDTAAGLGGPGAKKLLIVLLGGCLTLGLVFGAYKFGIQRSVSELSALTSTATGRGQ